METKTEYKYIVKKSENKEPMIFGSRIYVRDIVEQWRLCSTPEEISIIYPHITLSQIFEALAYYQDNKEEVEYFINLNKVPERLNGKSIS